MILKHYVKIKNNEEILVVHLDYNYEFSKFDNNSGIIHNITEYIHKHKIKFNGNKVILVVGSLMLGTLILNPLNYDKPLEAKDTYTYVSKITLANYNEKNELTSVQEINPQDKTVTEKKLNKKKLLPPKKALPTTLQVLLQKALLLLKNQLLKKNPPLRKQPPKSQPLKKNPPLPVPIPSKTIPLHKKKLLLPTNKRQLNLITLKLHLV